MLWEFGEPDALTEDERYFLYRWVTVDGYVVAIGYYVADAEGMGTKRRDMVLEFDERGVLVNLGEMESIVTEPIGDDVPIDRTLPSVLPVLQRSSGLKEWEPGTLYLEETRVALRPEGKAEPTVDIQSAAIALLH